MTVARSLALVALMMTAAIFGFFYAWICSTLWGLDTLQPAHAIKAMQAMNESVRNPVFFPAFFLTPVALGAASVAAWRACQTGPARLFAIAAAIYLVGGIGVTAIVNVPMNHALSTIDSSAAAETGEEIWQTFSGRWQFWNTVRTGASGLSVLLTGMALLGIRSEPFKAGPVERPLQQMS
ncbi:MAG: DUF1772 domain-containing protein [Hoeflea sp.]|uniref:anthrone oxygenase family protein n=1 Tax=Hoeflea sp. TaxID=1940281 RepID=UPI0032EC679C